MRLAVCALTTVLLSGCSWLGTGGHHSSTYGQGGGAYAGCHDGQGGYWAGNGCVGGSYGVGGQYGAGQGAYVQGPNGYGAYGGGAYGAGAGYGAGAYGTGAGYGAGTSGYGYGAGAGAGYGTGGAYGYSAQSTVLGAGAPFGSAVGGNIVGASYGGQYVPGAAYQTVQGSPIYVPQPYGVNCAPGVNCGGAVAVGGSLPFGIEAFGGTEFDIGGDIFTAKDPGLALGSTTVNTGGTDGISYDDAFGQMKSFGGALSYDVSRNTTLLGGVSYSTANGRTAERYQSVDARTPGTLEDIDAEFSDLDLLTIEGGFRQYMGYNPTFRPYIGATAGFTHNNGVDVQRTYSSDGVAFDPEPFEYVDAGWRPTAAGMVGAEVAVGQRAAIGVETGIRWRDNLDTIAESEDRWSIPLQLRGRVSF